MKILNLLNLIIEKRITPQQLQIIALMLEKGQVTTNEIIERLNISKQSIGDKVNLMIAKDLIVRDIGDYRIYHYRLHPKVKEKFLIN